MYIFQIFYICIQLFIQVLVPLCKFIHVRRSMSFDKSLYLIILLSYHHSTQCARIFVLIPAQKSRETNFKSISRKNFFSFHEFYLGPIQFFKKILACCVAFLNFLHMYVYTIFDLKHKKIFCLHFHQETAVCFTIIYTYIPHYPLLPSWYKSCHFQFDHRQTHKHYNH